VTARDITVIKCGGHTTVTPAALSADLAALTASGRPMVVVHGGSADIDRLGARLNVPMRRLTAPDGVSGRYTDPATLEVVTLALAGGVRPRLVAALLAAGVPAVGLTGIDGGLLRARRRRTQRAMVDGRQVIVRDDHSGRITEVNTALLDCLLAAGVVPVVSPPVLAEDGAPVNADADRAAAAIAIAMRAATLVLLTSAPGVLADPADPLSVLSVCEVPQAGPPAQRAGGMGVKLTAAREALAAGVREVLVADGRVPAPVSRALAGCATRVAVATLMQGGRR
jgi:acetylglutamate/LysW-gamma-L-alpha-aminoadipate kinase